MGVSGGVLVGFFKIYLFIFNYKVVISKIWCGNLILSMHSALINLRSNLNNINTGYEFVDPFQEEWEHNGMDPRSNDVIQKLVTSRLCDS